MDSLRVFREFKLDTLDDGWVKSVWDAEFVGCDEPPDEWLEYLESQDARLLLHESRHVLKVCLASHEAAGAEERPEFSWQTLMILGVNVRGLLAMLGYIIKAGQQADTDEDSRRACLEATSLYLTLLAVPGSNAFGVYHPNLYQRAIETLKLSEDLFVRAESSRETDATVGCSDELSSDRYGSSHADRSHLARALSGVISDLVAMLRSFRFKEHAVSRSVTIRALLDVTRLEMHKSRGNFGSALQRSAFAALHELCSSNHGSVAVTVMLIAEYMLPDMLFHHANAQPRTVTVVHEAGVHFLKNLLRVHEKETVQAIRTLIQQLMSRCPERLEGRQRQAAVIVRLLNICEIDVVVGLLGDLISFSHNVKILCRLFAQEIAARLLTESPLRGDSLDGDVRLKLRKILLAIVLSRCEDHSALVRGRAMATLAAFSDCNDKADRGILRGMFKAPAADKAFLGPGELRDALTGDVDPLPGSGALVAMLLDRVNEERALVRRSALKISQNLCTMFPSLVGKLTHAMSDRCRDPAVTVRQYAVQVLSEILQQFPDDPGLVDEWIQAVLPQIYDVEVKMQEKVLECLGCVLINRITNAAAYVPDAAGSLPWRVLDRLSRMRMRKHLSKACGLWVGNGSLTKSVISKVQSHVGTDNTVGAWILMAALAENTRIPNIASYVTDYKEVVRKNDFHASLVLDVLRHAWPALDRNHLKDLHRHLYECVCHFEVHFNLISVCLDILGGVSQHLHADDSGRSVESDMVELMKLSEAEIRDLLEAREDRARDKVKIRAVFTLGHASLLCTRKISLSTLRVLERLLSQWDSLPSAVKEVQDLQAFAVVFLCQQALRDFRVAKEVTPLLGSLMRQETHDPSLRTRTAVKINAAKALADICVRFTALVEPYLPDLCVSMKDPNPAVREAIVVIFVQLLLEDFIKMKGAFFFHILTMLSDAEKTIRELTVFLVEERLLVKNKNLISRRFVDSIYHYNNCRYRDAFCGHRMREQEKKLLTLPGWVNQGKRHVIYEFMLQHVDVSARSELVVKLTRYILCEICNENSIDVTTEEGACVLRDAMFILGHNRLQPSSLGERHRDDTQELNEASPTPSGTPSNNASNVAIAAMKKYNLNNLLPTLIALKKKLLALKSPLKDDAEGLLFKIYSEYEKEHLADLLDEYPKLEREMDRYQRRLKDKINSESDNVESVKSSPRVRHKDLLVKKCEQMIPRVILHRISSLTPHYESNESADPDNCPQITSSYDALIKDPSVHPERSLLIQTPPPEPSLVTSTPISTRNLNSSDSPVREARIESPSNARETSQDISRHEILRDSVN
ncbi:PREDICTED: condensin-2 complex subunit D3-like [Vollenhovia emeryi]|uniref:condensin-2 complex subunit D3-like n=1 Tax=Vollenhovia emeryi TaxID=411798 RepID=UPI0005F45D5E|nr:PREDICTED: condensin-2 complex subunit D3-like [Vollenhovia emeryi]